jgi:hypothetical protein
MKKRVSILPGALALAFLALPAFADEIKGADRILCSISSVNHCSEDNECSDDIPSNINVPKFMEVDLAGKKVQSTKASGENRSSSVDLKRDGGLVIIQGFENGRAFSIVISETTGRSSMAVARDGIVVSAFGACTPIATAK